MGAPAKTKLIDLFWRSFWTFVTTFITSFQSLPLIDKMFDGVTINLSAMQLAAAAATVAGLSAVGTVIKVFGSNELGTGTATSRAEPVVGPAPVASLTAVPAQ